MNDGFIFKHPPLYIDGSATGCVKDLRPKNRRKASRSGIVRCVPRRLLSSRKATFSYGTDPGAKQFGLISGLKAPVIVEINRLALVRLATGQQFAVEQTPAQQGQQRLVVSVVHRPEHKL